MVLDGQIINGEVVLSGPVPLPDGTKVRIVPVEASGGRTLADRFQNIIGAVDDLPEDMADNHDHYLHGTPKR